MDIHGFHVVSVLDTRGQEGFATTVTHPDGIQQEGPFFKIEDAVKCAHAWNEKEPGAKGKVEAEKRKKEVEAVAENRKAEEAAKNEANTTNPPETPV